MRRSSLQLRVRFGAFVVITFALFALFDSVPFRERVAEPYLALNASSAAEILRAAGKQVVVLDTSFYTSEFGLRIDRGCDGLLPMGMVLAAVLVSPVSLSWRLAGALVGLVFLFLVNQARIVSLYFTGVYFPDTFEVMHADVWQVLFIGVAVSYWVLWATRAPDVSP